MYGLTECIINKQTNKQTNKYILLQSLTITPVSPTADTEPKWIQINTVYLHLYNSCTLKLETQENF